MSVNARIYIIPALMVKDVWKPFLIRYSSFILAGTGACLVILFTCACEYYVTSAGALPVRELSTSYNILSTLLHIVRFIALCAAIASWAWWTGAVAYESSPVLKEAIGSGAYSAVRCAFVLFPIWLLGFVFSGIFISVIRVLTLVYSSVGLWAALCGALLGVSLFLPPLIAIAAKFIYLVPVALFEKGTALEKIARASIMMPMRKLAVGWWPALAACGFFMTFFCLLPSWGLLASTWKNIYGFHISPALVFQHQCAMIVVILLAAPVAIYMITSFYLISSALQPSDETMKALSEVMKEENEEEVAAVDAQNALSTDSEREKRGD